VRSLGQEIRDFLLGRTHDTYPRLQLLGFVFHDDALGHVRGGIELLAETLVDLDVDEFDLAAHFRQDRLEPRVESGQDRVLRHVLLFVILLVVEPARFNVDNGTHVDRNGERVAQYVDLVLDHLDQAGGLCGDVLAVLGLRDYDAGVYLVVLVHDELWVTLELYLGYHTLHDKVAAPDGDDLAFVRLDGFRCYLFYEHRIVEPDLALLHRAGRDAPDVEGTHGQLRARLSDRLGGDDADRLADVDVPRRRQVAAVTFPADAVLGLAGEHRADLDRIDIEHVDHLRDVLGDDIVGRADDIAGDRVQEVVEERPAQRAVAQ